MINKSKELAKNTLIIALGRISMQLISLLMLPLFTIYLDPDDFGTVDLVVTYVTLLAPAITLQMDLASFRFLIDVRGDQEKSSTIITNTLYLTSIFMCLFSILYLVFFAVWSFSFGLYLLGNIFVSAYITLFLQYARGLGKNKHFAIASAIIGLSTLISNLLLLVVFDMGVAGILTSNMLASINGIIYLFFSLKIIDYVDLKKLNKKVRKSLLKYSVPLIPNGISWWVISVSDRTIISIFISIAANGIYAVANKFALVFTTLFSIFGMSWTESAALHIKDSDRDEFFSKTFNTSIRFFGSLGLIAIAFIPFIFPLVIDDAYNEALLYIPILLVGALFNAVVGLYSAIYIANKMSKQVAMTSLFAAIINLVINLTLIKFIGVYSAAVSTAIAYFIMSVYRHHDVKKYVKISYETTLFISLCMLYILVIGAYYTNNVPIQIFAIILTLTTSYKFNKNFLHVLISKSLIVLKK